MLFLLFSEYDNSLKKPIASRYGNGMFQKFFRSDGQTFNVSDNVMC